MGTAKCREREREQKRGDWEEVGSFLPISHPFLVRGICGRIRFAVFRPFSLSECLKQAKIITDKNYQRRLPCQVQMVLHVFLFRCHSSLLWRYASHGRFLDTSARRHICLLQEILSVSFLFPCSLHLHLLLYSINWNQSFVDASF